MPHQPLLAFLLTLILSTAVTSCGQKGPLYLPDSTQSEFSR